jgi:hypothetical protein
MEDLKENKIYMTTALARYLTCLIANDYEQKSTGCISSYECELLEERFKQGRFEEIQSYLTKKLWSK